MNNEITDQCSELFADIFDSCSGGNIRTCACGRTFYNYMDTGSFDTGELEKLEAKQKSKPEKYFACDHTIGTMEIGDVEIVYGCQCDLAKKYEQFILAHAEQLSEYLRRYAATLREKADSVDVPNK